MPRKKRVIRKQGKSIISDEIFIPNHSGTHDAGIRQKVPTNEFDLVNKKYVDDQDGLYVLKVGDTMTGDLTFTEDNQINFRVTSNFINSISEGTLDINGGDEINFYIGVNKIGLWDINGLIIGVGGIDRDYKLTFDGNTNDGIIQWMEGEDYFKFKDDILMETSEKILFRDNAIFIHSNADGEMTIEADSLITMGTTGITKIGELASNHINIDSTGKTLFVGTAGLVFGSMSQENVPTTITISGIGTAEIVDGMTGGETNNITFQNSQELKALNPGKHFISWAVSFNMASGSGQEIEGAIGIDGNVKAEGSAHRKIGTGNDTGSICGSAILDLAIDEKVTIMVTNKSSTVDIVIAHASLSLMQVGG